MSDAPKTEAARFTPDEVIAKQRNRQLLVVSVIIVVLAAAVWGTRMTRTAEAPLKEVSLIGGTKEDPRVKKEDIGRIQIWKGPDGEKLELVREGDDWRVPSRFNAPATREDVDSLITRIYDSSRLNRASTTTQTQFINYSLNDEDAVHLRLEGAQGKEFLHVLVGRAEGGMRDFVRIAGEGAPEGVFELTGLGGQFDTLYGALNLDAKGQPAAKRWINTKSFAPLPFEAVAQEITIQDDHNALTFNRESGSDPAADQWLLTSPRKGEADGTNVRAIVDALSNYHASDIAARVEDAAKFDLVAPAKELSIKYTVGEKMTTMHLYFGKKNDNGEIAVLLKTADKGEFIYWASDFVLTRIFRPTLEFMRKVRINLIPDGVNVDTLNVQDGDATLALTRESVGAVPVWKMTAPLEMEADRVKVSNLLTTLNTLQGYPDSSEFDRSALELGPGLSKRVVTAVYPVTRPADDSDGDDEPDTPDGDETTPAETPEETPAETTPKLKTAILYFGKMQQGELPVLRVIDGVEQMYWVKADAGDALFQSATDYVKPTDVALVGAGKKASVVRVAKDEAVLELTSAPDAQGQVQWRIQQPWDEIADQASADALLRAAQNLRGAKLPQPLDKAAYGLGEGLSKRQLDLQLKAGETTSNVVLYIGSKLSGLHTGMVVRADGAEEFWLFSTGQLFELFASPADYKVLGTFDVKVRHILLTWKGRAPGLAPKDPNRTEEQAHELANDIVRRTIEGEDFVELQKQYNEDSDPTHVYDVSPTSGLVKPFTRLSSELKVGEVGIVESNYGLHVIKRIE